LNKYEGLTDTTNGKESNLKKHRRVHLEMEYEHGSEVF